MRRLVDYFDKGFDLILPDLDMAALPTRNLEFDTQEVLDLPNMLVYYNRL